MTKKDGRGGSCTSTSQCINGYACSKGECRSNLAIYNSFFWFNNNLKILLKADLGGRCDPTPVWAPSPQCVDGAYCSDGRCLSKLAFFYSN